jgi:hypothetical protein
LLLFWPDLAAAEVAAAFAEVVTAFAEVVAAFADDDAAVAFADDAADVEAGAAALELNELPAVDVPFLTTVNYGEKSDDLAR